MKLYDSLIFYNHYGNGDIFINREFVKEIMQKFPARKFFFTHAKDPYLLSDIPELRYMILDKNCDMRLAYNIVGENVYINTWIGYAWGKYVESGATCTIDNYKRMYNDTFKLMNMPIQLDKNLIDYIPSVDYRKLHKNYLNNIDIFASKTCGGIYKDIILISNGDVQSGQADNFNFTPTILELCREYPNKYFIITENLGTTVDYPKNLFDASAIIDKKGCDLLEISYLSTVCGTVIGRSSGPYVYSQVRINYDQDWKNFISFTHNKKGGHLAFFDVPASRYWNSTLDYNLIKRVLNG